MEGKYIIWAGIFTCLAWIPLAVFLFNREFKRVDGRLCYSLLPPFMANPTVAIAIVFAIIYYFFAI
jgi:hypothetical protein